MAVKIIHCDQGSPEWFAARKGKPTASMFHAVMAQASGRAGTMPVRRRYLLNLASEIITGDPIQSYSNRHMERGSAMEPEARSALELISDLEVQPVGFIINDGLVKGKEVGASTDGLIGEKKILEIKTQEPHLLIERMLEGGETDEHKAQCQGGMWVTEREQCELAVFWPKLPIYRRTIKRDDAYIRKLEIALPIFWEELDEIVDQIKRYGGR